MKTSTPKPPAPQWVLIDAEGQNLGRLSAQIATILRGKHRPEFTPHQICGDHIVVVNAAKLHFHPTKYRRKEYFRHTGYFGHLKKRSLTEMMERKPTEVITKAVRGMLPANRLRKDMLKRLHVFAESEHPHEAQQPVPLS